ncbi:IS66 family insertion sequence element accessory protein TnpA [Maridesulfovibrio sp.]|uniref:IS66 family insertion sequence element accessory protein TnpA n=1 Tax=Maridesulfovibrio sp. TaxID=2795000 RepID=UPI002A188621|nr:hypothetical protein [Maridesulfovibrio sp.]
MSENIGSRSNNEKYWQKLVNNWRESVLSQAEFSKQANISERVLGCWKRKFERKQVPGEKSHTVVAVPIERNTSPKQNSQLIIIHAWHRLRINRVRLSWNKNVQKLLKKCYVI